MKDIFSAPLSETIREAWALRSEFDLNNVGYGRIHWGNLRDVVRTPSSQYFFLAGITRLTGATKVLEIGTHQGGSTRSIAKGLSEPAKSRIVTFDVTPDGAAAFAGDPVIHAYNQNANSPEALDTCLREFGSASLDFAFIDSTHDFWTTFQHFGLCASLLSCPLIILDDITLNDSMLKLWTLIRQRYGAENAVNAAEIDPAIRKASNDATPGFGIVRIPQHL
jgi:predicted O-methyltransferase YrrM